MNKPLVYEPDHPAIEAQNEWIDAHGLNHERAFFKLFREWINSGRLDPMLTLFQDAIEDRKDALKRHH